MRLIDADALKQKFTMVTKQYKPNAIMERAAILLEDVDKAPTIDAEPVRHGKWIQDRLMSTSGGTYGVRRCSLCEAYYQDVGCGWNYCPHCGAKMDADEISNIARESADKISKALEKVRANGIQKQNIKEDDKP